MKKKRKIIPTKKFITISLTFLKQLLKEEKINKNFRKGVYNNINDVTITI